MVGTTVESIIESFPTSNIPSVEGEPTYKSIKEVEKYIITNASSIESELGGGQHGLLGLVIPPARCSTVTGHTFVPHANPGALPTFPQNPTQPQITQANATHKEQLRLWREQNMAIKALKKQLTSVFEPKHLEEMHDNYAGFNNVTIQEIFAHLFDKYGDLDEEDVETLDKQLAEPYDPNEPFGAFVKRVEDIMEVAEAAGCAYTPEQITSKAFNLISKSQAYPEGCREWKRKPLADKTWTNLKNHFAIEAKDYRKKSAYQAKDTHQAAHAANQALLEAQAEFRDYTSSFLTEFQQAMAKQEQTDVAPQQAHATTTSTEMTTLAKELRAQLQEARDQNRALLKIIQSFGQDKENQNPNSTKGGKKTKWKYCWSCGANWTHESNKYFRPKEGYKLDVSFKDTKGGSTWNCRCKEVKALLSKSDS